MQPIKTITITIVILLTMISLISVESVGQSSGLDSPDNQIKTSIGVLKDLHKKYGSARLILKDRSIYKRIMVHEINSFWIVFIKDGSLHDMLIEKIARIEYGKDLGPTVTFNEDNKIVISY